MVIKRILRSAIVFAAIFAAYQAYVLFAVPWMEPPLAVRENRRVSHGEPDEGRPVVTTWQLLLSNYFPKGHWTQTLPPKVFASSNEQAMLVLDAYKRLELQASNDRANAEGDGAPPTAVHIKIDRFALLIFPTPPREGITPPRDAIILEAPQGALLQFDDFRPERGRIGQITHGQFPGRITIRSDMREPGPADDLLIETADVEMNTRRLSTVSNVRFRMGPNVGAGREMEIRFLADEHVQPHETGLKFTGLDSLEIQREVRMRLHLETDSLLPGNETTGSHAPRGNPLSSRSGGDGVPSGAVGATQALATQSVGDLRSHAEPGNELDKTVGNEKPKPPVELTCSGPFHFDFIRYIASVDRDVVLRQIHPNGPSDQLTCNQLDIHFAPRPLVDGQADPVIVDPGKRQQRELGRLEPAAIVAEGLPVVVTSPSRSAEARGDRIQIDLRDQRVLLSGGRNVRLVYGPNVLQAPAIAYQHAGQKQAAGSAGSMIGSFSASGPGSLHYVPDPAEPDQVLSAVWQRSVQLIRDGQQPTLVLEGRPQLAFAETGAMVADEMKLSLRELPGDSAETGISITAGAGGRGSSGRLEVMPQRLVAKGRVEIQSRQLSGRTHELTADFRQPANEQANAADPEYRVPRGGWASASDAKTSASGSTPGAFNLAPGAGPTSQAYHVDADRIQIEVLLTNRSATRLSSPKSAPSSVVCDGNVVLREVPLARTTEQPFEIRGGRLTATQLDSGTALITLTGADKGEAPGLKLVQLTGRGITMLADVVELDQRENRLWSNGPGKATLLVTRDLNGRAAATPVPLDISWQAGLEFDGRTIVFRRNVVAAGTDDTLRCDELSARLTRPVQFGERVDQQAIDLEEAQCRGNVSIDHRARDEVGVISHERLQLMRLTVNQQTGDITGDGPGVVRSTRFGDGLTTLTKPARSPQAETAIAPPPSAAGSKLFFLGVDFQQGLKGNMYTRELELFDRVRTVYGPVDSWEQELDVTRPETLPPESIRLLCDQLRVNEDPIAARRAPGEAWSAAGQNADSRPLGPIQLQATHNVRIDGHSSDRGPFVAQANRASYDEVKDVFVLEGDLRAPATITYPGQTGSPPAFRKISFVRSTGELKVGGLLYMEVTPGDVENARRPGAIQH